MEKILIYENRKAMNDFLNSVTEVRDQCNFLIKTFHSYQGFKRIKDIEEFDALCGSPSGYYDQTILENSPIPKGQYKINAVKLAELMDLDRTGYLSTLGCETSSGDDCVSCGHKRVTKKGNPAINYPIFKNYSQYFKFSAGVFSLDQEAINKELESFRIYATSEKQVQMIDHWKDILNILQSHLALNLIGPAKLSQICDLFGYIRMVDNKLYLKEENLYSLILKTK